MSRFAAPAPEGDQLQPAEINGHLLLVIPTEFVPKVITKFTKPNEEGTDAIRVDVCVLTQQDQAGQNGVVYRGALWFNVMLRNSLKKQIGQVVLARMGQGQGKPGQDPPWVLVDATSDQQALTFAEQWLNAHPEFEADAQQQINQTASQAGNNVASTNVAQVPSAVGVPVPGVPQVASQVPAVAQQVAPIPTAAPALPATPQVAPVGLPTTQAASIQPAAPQISAEALAALPESERAKLLALLGGQ